MMSASVKSSEIIFWNCAHGLVAKIDYVHHYLSVHKPELFFITEAEIKKDKSYLCLSFPGYELHVSKTLVFGCARSAVYVKNNSNFKRNDNLENGSSEILVFENNKLRVCGIYRPFKNIRGFSSHAAFDSLLKNLELVVSCGKDVIVGGDLCELVGKSPT